MPPLSAAQNLQVIEAMIASPELAEALLQPRRVEDPDPLIAELERALGIWREVPR